MSFDPSVHTAQTLPKVSNGPAHSTHHGDQLAQLWYHRFDALPDRLVFGGELGEKGREPVVAFVKRAYRMSPQVLLIDDFL